jgi:methyl-accepting chemotaxis protein
MPNTEVILIILVAVIAVAGLFLLVVLFAMFMAMKKGIKVASDYATDLQSQVVPALQNSTALIKSMRDLIVKLEPKLESAATDIAEITRVASAETKKLQVSTDEIAGRIRRQAERVDGLTTEALNTVEQVGHVVNQTVSMPLRKVAGVVAAAKAVIETLGKSSRARTRN